MKLLMAFIYALALVGSIAFAYSNPGFIESTIVANLGEPS